jgi:hypothetical protein
MCDCGLARKVLAKTFIGVHLTGVHLTDIYLKGGTLWVYVLGAKSSAKSVTDLWGTMISKVGCNV